MSQSTAFMLSSGRSTNQGCRPDKPAYADEQAGLAKTVVSPGATAQMHEASWGGMVSSSMVRP